MYLKTSICIDLLDTKLTACHLPVPWTKPHASEFLPLLAHALDINWPRLVMLYSCLLTIKWFVNINYKSYLPLSPFDSTTYKTRWKMILMFESYKKLPHGRALQRDLITDNIVNSKQLCVSVICLFFFYLIWPLNYIK